MITETRAPQWEQKPMAVLQGSEKQTAWASSIRCDMLRHMDSLADSLIPDAEKVDVIKQTQQLICRETEAAWFIRTWNELCACPIDELFDFYSVLYDQLSRRVARVLIEPEVKHDDTNTIVDIACLSCEIVLSNRYNRDVVQVIYDISDYKKKDAIPYKWSGRDWRHHCEEGESPEKLAVQTAKALYNAGFSVLVSSPRVAELVLAADEEPEDTGFGGKLKKFFRGLF